MSTAADQVRLVALREIRERVRTRSFQVSTALLVVGAIVAVAVGRATGGGGPAALHLGVVGQTAVPVRADVRVERFEAEPAARRALDRRAIDVVLVPGRRVLVRTPPEAGSRVAELAALLARDSGVRTSLLRSGVDEATVDQALAGTRPLPVTATTGAAPAARDDDDSGAAFIGAVVLYLALMFAGYGVASGVVEEKTSRVVEVLLTSVRPTRLLAGKVLGIGLTGLAQLAAAAVPVLVAVLVLDADAIPDASGRVAVWSLVWFVLGYAVYACAYAAAGVLAGRQEDMQVVTIPVTALLVASYLVSLQALDDPDGTLATVGSLLPPFAPLVLPGRMALTDVPVWQPVLSVVLTLALAAALLAFAARVYRGALLRIGARTRLASAWRSGAAQD